jgi:hypothetical protein
MQDRVPRQLRLLKTCLAAGAAVFRITPSELAQARDLSTFLLDQSGSVSPRELAANALLELTIGDLASMDAAVCVAIVDFLDRTLGKPVCDRNDQRLRDLKDPIQKARTKRQFMRWVTSWYPD